MTNIKRKPIGILLVEDNPPEADLFRYVLKKEGVGKFKLTHVDTIRDAVSIVNEQSFDLILLDLSLPDTQGLETLNKMHRQASGCPIVVLTATDNEEMAINAVQAGAQDYLVKGQINHNLIIRSIRYSIERQKMKEELRKTIAELVKSNAELEQFTFVASHDLQEPLRMIGSYTQLLARRYKGKLDKDADEFIEFTIDGVNRMQALIDDLLTFSRIGTKGKSFQPTNCTAVLETKLQDLKFLVEESDATVNYDSLPTVHADKVQLGQLFQNLISNAIKFRDEKPPVIHIGAEQKDDYWTFFVKDNGIGIDHQYKEQVFTIFQRLHTRKEYSGTGIGLAVCKKIVDRHGGKIWLESELGTGTTFYFTIPADNGNTSEKNIKK